MTWRAIFARPYIEGAGTIPTERLADLMGALGITLDPTQLAEASEQLDADKAGTVSYGEFVMWWNG
jgi:Ca2+-binding EF-hand superfamily protein